MQLLSSCISTMVSISRINVVLMPVLNSASGMEVRYRL